MKFDLSKNVIHVDMDGVLADFDRFVLERLGRTFDHASGPGADKEMWDFLHGIPDLYFVLEPTSYAKELWDFANSFGCKVRILSAVPRRTTMPEAEDQKRRWLVKHESIFGPHVDFNIGPFSRDKWKHARSGDILIDDRRDNCEEWISRGNGIAVLHKSLQDTIAQVQQAVLG